MSEAAKQLILVRPATADDAEPLAAVYVDSAEHHLRLDPSLYTQHTLGEITERYRRRLPLGDDAEILVADIAGEVVGWVEIQLRPPGGEPRMLRDALTAEIDIAVLSDYRGARIGSDLLAAAEEWAAARHVEFMTVEVHTANVDAARFYQDHHGWRTAGLFMLKRPEPAS
ncbi:MAG TPA: GNAT family N-acetyltransferase [Candidatus Dormibacteraeota bacterium]|jgi:GNAT superfamily N-acetyltransferase|nr:GNAT family N-acetyltransferase [Candidatus Dormibacteraeota bacterium]